jgi:hypothetical protein
MYQKTQLNQAYRPPQAFIQTSRPPQKQSNSTAAVGAFVVMFIIITSLIIIGYALSQF